MKDKKRDKITAVIAIFTAIMISAIIFFVTSQVMEITSEEDKEEFIVGNYVGEYYFDIRDKLIDEGVDVVLKKEYSDSVEKDYIISQDKEENEKIKINGYKKSITLVVSNGVNLIEIPELANSERREAEIKLKKLGIQYEIKREHNEDIDANNVIKTEPIAGEKVNVDEIVIVYVSDGLEIKETEVPYLIGKNEMEAKRLLADAKLHLGELFPKDSQKAIDNIIKQNPEAGKEVPQGTAVNLYFEEKQEEIQEIYVDYKIMLVNEENYGDKISVIVEVIPSETNKSELMIDDDFKKEDFPINVKIPVTQNNKTHVKIYFDGNLVKDHVESLSEV